MRTCQGQGLALLCFAFVQNSLSVAQLPFFPLTYLSPWPALYNILKASLHCCTHTTSQRKSFSRRLICKPYSILLAISNMPTWWTMMLEMHFSSTRLCASRQSFQHQWGEDSLLRRHHWGEAHQFLSTWNVPRHENSETCKILKRCRHVEIYFAPLKSSPLWSGCWFSSGSWVEGAASL